MADIALYPGGYKPPHIGHYKASSEALGQADKIIVFVGPKERDGITQAMSIKLWQLYTQNDPIEIRKAGVSPVRDVYDFVELEAEDGDTLYFIKGEKDSEDPRFVRIPSYAEKFNKKINIKYIDVPDQTSRTDKEVSGRLMRDYIKNQDKESFIDGLPEGIDEDKAWNIVTGGDWEPGDPVSKEMWDGWSLKIGAGKEYNENLKNREDAVAHYRPEKAEEWAYKRYEYVAPKIKGFGPEIEDGGWHYSYVGGADQVTTKAQTIAEGDTKYKRELFVKQIEEALKNKTSPYSSEKLVKLKLEQLWIGDFIKLRAGNITRHKDSIIAFPDFLINNPTKYKHLFSHES